MKTGVQTWRDLLFLHWELDEADARALQARLPRGVELDRFEGRAYVGVIPFTMARVRVGPLPLGTFLEANVRTYVRAGRERVGGVWFLSLDAESPLMVKAARAIYGLPYFTAALTCDRDGDAVTYSSRRAGLVDASLDARWTVLDRAPHAASPDTLEYFLTERYCFYAPSRDGGAKRLRVVHTPWPLYRARVESLQTTLLDAAGLASKRVDPIDLVLASPEGVATETFSAEAP